MKPSRPYIARALFEWILDNDLTPYVLVDATRDYVAVPLQFVEDGQIVLNLAPSAVRDFYIGDDAITFNARFSGQPMDVYLPMSSLLAIYARENGQGMGFGAEPGAEAYMQGQESESPANEVDDAIEKPAVKLEKKKPSLKVVK